MIKYYSVLVIRFVLRLFYIFPIKKNTIVLTSFAGRQYSCNPKYICEYMKNNSDFNVIFAIKNEHKDLVPKWIKTVRFGSIRHIYLLMTSKTIIVNSSDFTKYLPFRKKQCYINTWHGSFIFKIGDKSNLSNKYGLKLMELCEDTINYYIRNCKIDVGPLFLRNEKGQNKYLDLGYPRNDIFFNSDTCMIENIKKKLNIPFNKKIVLYAPTYRDNYNCDQNKSMADYGLELLDLDRVINIFNVKFKEDHIMLYRAHHNMIPNSISDNAMNVSSYPDMQELLLITDYIITDYSSSMVDFATQGKPGFLFTPDIDEFSANIPDFNPIDKWPYHYARTNAEFYDLVNSYDRYESIKKIRDFLDFIGSSDDGNASERIYNVILNYNKKR